MSRPRGELSRTHIDREWPHQIALPADRCTGKNFDVTNAFCRNLSVYWRRHGVTDGQQEFLVFCFKEPGDAAAFKAAFHGAPFYPEDRKGRKWNRPAGDRRRPGKARGPYDWS